MNKEKQAKAVEKYSTTDEKLTDDEVIRALDFYSKLRELASVGGDVYRIVLMDAVAHESRLKSYAKSRSLI